MLPKDTFDELRRLQHSLQLCLVTSLSQSPPLGARRQGVIAEMTRRSHTFATCAIVTHSFLLGYPNVPLSTSEQLRFPCSQDVWEEIHSSDLEQGSEPRLCQGELVSYLVDKLLECPNGYDATILNEMDSTSPCVATVFILQRLCVTREASKLSGLASAAKAEEHRCM
jgi:hypothetical protein